MAAAAHSIPCYIIITCNNLYERIMRSIVHMHPSPHMMAQPKLMRRSLSAAPLQPLLLLM